MAVSHEFLCELKEKYALAGARGAGDPVHWDRRSSNVGFHRPTLADNRKSGFQSRRSLHEATLAKILDGRANTVHDPAPANRRVSQIFGTEQLNGGLFSVARRLPKEK